MKQLKRTRLVDNTANRADAAVLRENRSCKFVSELIVEQNLTS